MIVMPSNNAKGIVHYWAGQGYPVGWLFTPEGSVREPVPWIPYAVDNGRFAVWSSGKDWCEHAFLKLLDYYNETILKPRFVKVSYFETILQPGLVFLRTGRNDSRRCA